jgi:phosphoserine phosphatase RsbU/P
MDGHDAIPIRALLVDDDPFLLELLSAYLQERGYSVAHAADGRAALDILEAGHDFNLVVTDRQMPHMDGLALCRAIRRLPGPYVYCVMLTATGDEDSLVLAMEAGMDDFIAKPLQFAELGARLRAAERVLALEAGLAARNGELQEAYGHLSRELELARTLQRSQLPPPAAFGAARFHWYFESSSFVGGDVFDYFEVDDAHVAFHLVDVSGHGAAAAMMAFNAQHQLAGVTQQAAAGALRSGESLGAVVTAVVGEFNRRVMQMKETSHYLTLLFGIIDRHSGRGAFVQAGHPPPLVAAPASGFEPLGEGGLPVGILAEPGFEARTFSLSPGSRMVLYSDGVTDSRNAQGEAFGADRLRRLVDGQRRAGLAALCDTVQQAMRAWRPEAAPEDDITFVALEFA